MTRLKSATLASAAALLTLGSMAVTTPAFAKDEKVRCFGVNTCKGQSDCKSGIHDCKGMNSCKGQGFKAMTAFRSAVQGGSQASAEGRLN